MNNTKTRQIPYFFNFDLDIDGNIYSNGIKLTFEDFKRKTNCKAENVDLLLCVTFYNFRLHADFWDKCGSFKTNNKLMPIMAYFKEPIETGFLEGFYFIPYFSGYIVNREGAIYTFPAHKRLTISKTFDYVENKPSYVMVALNPDFIYKKSRYNLGLHRLLCLAFKKYKSDFTKLDVNHIDSNRRNNQLDNLEWVTRSGNLVHAFKNGQRTDNKPVLLRDVASGIVKEFYSFSELARVLNVTESTIKNRIVSGTQFCFHGKQFKLKSNTCEWEKDPIERGALRNIYEIEENGKKYEIEKTAELEKLVKKSHSTILKYIRESEDGSFVKNGLKVTLKSKSHASGTMRWSSSNCGKLSNERKSLETIKKTQKKLKETRRLKRLSNKRQSAAKLLLNGERSTTNRLPRCTP